MKFYALLAVVCLAVFAVVGCDNPPKPQEATFSEGDVDSEPSVYTLDQVILVEDFQGSAPARPGAEAEVESTEPAATAKGPGINPFAKPTTPAKKPATPVASPFAAAPITAAAPAEPVTTSEQGPKDVLKQFAQAIEDGSEIDFTKAVYFAGDLKPLKSEMFALFQAATEFSTKMQQEYGANALAGSMVNFVVMPSPEEIDSLKIDISGDRALVRKPGQSQPMTMIKQEGQWLIDISNSLPAEVKAMTSRKKLLALIAAIKKAERNIGKTGYNAKRINNELQTALAGAAMGAPTMDSLGGMLKGMKVGR